MVQGREILKDDCCCLFRPAVMFVWRLYSVRFTSPLSGDARDVALYMHVLLEGHRGTLSRYR